jgi:hypothetical protein
VLCANEIVKSEISIGHKRAKAGAMSHKIIARPGSDKSGAKAQAVINLH